MGIDLDKRSFQSCLKDGVRRVPDPGSPRLTTALEARRLLAALKGKDSKAFIEATSNHWARLYDLLEDKCARVLLANPVKTRLIAETRVKSIGRRRRLADLLRGNLVADGYVLLKEETGLEKPRPA
ncbi:MAG: hypothetical protein QW587_04060 [Candidatus Bathyarchaeia archaeon]